MLIEFRFRNYKCFKNEQKISMVAAPDKTHQENLINVKGSKIKLIKAIAIYGANASGKSKLLDAIHFVDHFVCTSAKSDPDDSIDVEPFLFDSASKNSPSDFEVSFIQNDIRYQYGFTVTSKQIIHEWLYSWPKQREALLFDRQFSYIDNSYTYKFSDLLTGEKETIKKITSPNALFLSVAATANNEQLINVYKWFRNGLKGFSNNGIPLEFVQEVTKDDKIKKALLEIIKQADYHISDFIFYKDDIHFPKEFPESKKKLLLKLTGSGREIKVKLEHKLANGNKEFLDFDDESEGTRRFFSFSALFLSALQTGGLIYIDELDSSLHTNLVKQIIKMIHNSSINCNNAQLIFNTHDTNMLSPDLFRRDQIWFVEKDNNGISNVYSLAEFSPRKGEAIEKGYLEGRYGAIPLIDDFENIWEGNGC